MGFITTQVGMGVTLASSTRAVTQTGHSTTDQGELVAVQDAVDGLQGDKGHLHCPLKTGGLRFEPADRTDYKTKVHLC